MIEIRRQGSIADVIREARDIPSRVLPYAASTALTRVAKAGQKSVIDAMPSVFDRPVPYTLNSTRVVPSTVETLMARVAVREWASGNGTLPEKYLFPAVYGGPRREKRFERAMRYAGLLRAGEYAVLGSEAPLDASGNLQRGEMQRILTYTRSAIDRYQRASGSKRSRAGARRAQLFGGRVGVGNGPRGVWRREGRSVHPILVFVRQVPQYRRRLDFEGIVQRTAESEFEREFRTAADSITARRKG